MNNTIRDKASTIEQKANDILNCLDKFKGNKDLKSIKSHFREIQKISTDGIEQIENLEKMVNE